VQGWAELVAIDGSGQLNQLAWFGMTPALNAVPDTGEESARRPRRRRRFLASAEEGEPYLRAVTPS
jgi:hypothetical protein